VRTIPYINAPPETARLGNTDWLPSANLTWAAREDANLRLAYGRAVNRPEFREMSAVLYYDFDREQNVQGNPDLGRARIDNYDLRLEWFPRMGEVLAASVFYKRITDAIEERLLASPERYVRTWFNSPEGRNQGVELECRKGLGFLAEPLRFFSVTGNYTRIGSAIQYTELAPDGHGGASVTRRERLMQGQSPWSVNLSLLFAAPERGSSANLLYGRAGRRLDAVGDSRDEDVFEESRDLLELAVTQSFRSLWEAKLTAKNLLRRGEVKTMGLERSPFQRLTREPVWGLALSRNL
jgi:outer membrane receptor protein involved in Fe transport